jgi:integrase
MDGNRWKQIAFPQVTATNAAMEERKMCSYLQRRNATYYTRLVVPPRLRAIIGKTDLGRSLGTKDQAEAKRLLPEWLAEAQATVAAAEQELARRQASAAVANGPLTPEEADWQEENERFWREIDSKDETKAEAEERLEARLQRPEAELTTDEAAAARLLRDAHGERDRYRKRYRRRRRRDQLNGQPVAVNGAERLDWVRPTACPTVTVTGMFEGYASQEGSKATTVKQFRSIINHLVAFLGQDDANAVTLPDLVRWREHLRTEPIKGDKPRSAKTINDSYLAVANAVFCYGVNQLLIPANPATGLAKVRAPKAAKLRDKDFTNAERKKILSAALREATGNLSAERAFARRWVPWLCAYTGARVNEITQLRKEDVRELEGVWTIRITPEAGGVKTNEARTVPIHEHLIEQGFLTAISDKADGPLFYNPAQQRSGSERGQHKKVGMFLAGWVRNDLKIADPAIQPNHAWRHTFKGVCLEAEIEERAADYMQGHAPKGQGRRYGANTIAALASQLTKFPRFDLD